MTTFTPTQSTQTVTRVPALVAEPEIRFGLAHGVLIVILLVGAAGHLPTPLVGLAMLVTVLGVAGGQRLGLAIFLGISQWAMVTGFFVHVRGQLTFAPGDLVRLALFVTVTVIATRPRGRLAV